VDCCFDREWGVFREKSLRASDAKFLRRLPRLRQSALSYSQWCAARRRVGGVRAHVSKACRILPRARAAGRRNWPRAASRFCGVIVE